MKYFKVQNAYKKTFSAFTTLESEEMNVTNPVSFIEEEIYRWGYVIVQQPDSKDIVEFKDEIKSDSEEGYFNSDDYEMEEAHSDDHCSTYWSDFENITEDEVDSKYEENSDWSHWGYGPLDGNYVINGPMTVTDVTSEYQTV